MYDASEVYGSSNILVKVVDPRFVVENFTPKMNGDVGCDLPIWSPDKVCVLPPYTFSDLPTGIRVKVREGFFASVRPRSSSFIKHRVIVQEGTIDPGYTGELFVVVYNPNSYPVILENGSRLAQLIVEPFVPPVLKFVDDMPQTDRGENGFGSTGV